MEYGNESKIIKRKVFWYLLLRGVWLSNSKIIISESFIDWNKVNLGVKTILISFYYTPKIAHATKIPLPLNKDDLIYLPKLFSKAYLRYRKKKRLEV